MYDVYVCIGHRAICNTIQRYQLPGQIGFYYELLLSFSNPHGCRLFDSLDILFWSFIFRIALCCIGIRNAYHFSLSFHSNFNDLKCSFIANYATNHKHAAFQKNSTLFIQRSTVVRSPSLSFSKRRVTGKFTEEINENWLHAVDSINMLNDNEIECNYCLRGLFILCTWCSKWQIIIIQRSMWDVSWLWEQ